LEIGIMVTNRANAWAPHKRYHIGKWPQECWPDIQNLILLR
jgi:hypothetical protein